MAQTRIFVQSTGGAQGNDRSIPSEGERMFEERIQPRVAGMWVSQGTLEEEGKK